MRPLRDVLAAAAGPEGTGFGRDDIRRRVERRRRARRQARLAAAAVVLAVGGTTAAVGSRLGDSGPEVGTAAESRVDVGIVGRWQLTALSAETLDDPVFVEFLIDGRLKIDGCNYMKLQPWTAEAGELVVGDEFISTAVACPARQGRIDDALLGLVRRRPAVTHTKPQGTPESLRLDGPGGSFALFERARTTPAGPTLAGRLLDGRVFVVTKSEGQGLCAQVDQEKLGCDTDGGVLPRDADPATPRVADDTLIYACLPDGAVDVEASYLDGRSVDHTLLEIDVEAGFWALPVTPGDIPEQVSYIDADGSNIGTFMVAGRGAS